MRVNSAQWGVTCCSGHGGHGARCTVKGMRPFLGADFPAINLHDGRLAYARVSVTSL